MGIELVKLASGQPLPSIPSGLDRGMSHYLQTLHDYLRRLGGRFTEKQVAATVQNQFSFGYFYHYKGTNLVSIDIDTNDWRKREVHGYLRSSQTYNYMFRVGGVPTYVSLDELTHGVAAAGIYGGGSFSLGVDAGTGVLNLTVNPGVGSMECWIAIVGEYSQFDAPAINVGNLT